jgi:DNA-directed RNA polymerase specialized sigma24 family protein
MATRTAAAGRPVQEVDADTVRELTRIRNRMEKAEDVLRGLQNDRDEAISSAYMGGANKNRIATLVGVTVKTVDVSLRRSGAIDDY